MPNNAPIFSKAGDIEWTTLTAANTTRNGVGATVFFTAGATDGGYVRAVRLKPLGTNVSTVARIFLNNGGDPSVAANNSLITEKTLPATTATETAALPEYDAPIDMALPPNYRLMAALGTAVAAGIAVTAIGGVY